MIFVEDIINTVIRKYSCCAAWTIPISSLNIRERDFFSQFSPASSTAIVLGHHIVTTDEWKWFVNEDREHCDADDHSKKVCEEIEKTLGIHGFRTAIVPYPGESGLQFRSVAEAAGAGEIGINVFLLHPLWGPWIQLSVLATDALSDNKPISHRSVCTQCGECVSACPAGAIQEDSFDGLRCREYRREKGEYIPFGPEKELRYCTTCADVCPVGKKPEKSGKPVEG